MRRKIPNDTATFTFYDANPKGKKTGDCVVRAISAVTDKPWDEVLDGLTAIAHKYKEMPNDRKCYSKYLESLGFTKCKQPRFYMYSDDSYCKYTGSEFCELLNDEGIHGRKIFAHIGGHHVCAILENDFGEYTVHDTWDSTYYTIGNYWIKE